MVDTNYIDCGDCRDLIDNAKKVTPDLCKNKEALKYYQNFFFPQEVIPYSMDFNKNHDCKFVRLKFGALVRKAFEDN